MVEIKSLKIFIASPGDLPGERKSVKHICKELNKSPLVKSARIHLEATGWEDAVPQAGDPQEIVNKVVNSCDLFICIFHKHFGSPTAHHASGTLSEFLNAYDKWKTGKTPYIALYFKTMNISSKKELDDPQVKAVLAFKEKVQKDRLVLYRDFSDTQEFKVLVRKLIETWISGFYHKEKGHGINETAGVPDTGNISFHKTGETPGKTIVPKNTPGKQSKSGRILNILHISDLHIKKGEHFDRSVVFDPLLERLETDAEQNNLKPHLVVVSGDITWQGIDEEFNQAKQFFDRLLSVLHLTSEHIFFVPGNHDVNRKKYRPSDLPVFTGMKALNDELANMDYRADLFKGLGSFFSFVRQEYPHMKPVDGNLVPFVHFPQTPLSGHIALVGLNSAWMCRKSPDRDKIAIGEYQLKTALETVKKEKAVSLIINIFHHPIEWLWSRDRKLCRNYFHNSVCLTGHLHDSEGFFQTGYESRLYQFQAGGLYLGSESVWPCRYHYLTFNEDANTLRLDFRAFSRESHRWVLDGEKGDDGKKVFTDFFFKQKAKPGSITKTIDTLVQQDAAFEHYLTCVYNEHRYLPAKGFDLKLPVLIKHIYVKMRAFLHAACPGKGTGPVDFPGSGSRRTESGHVGIKEAFHILKTNTIKDMVILGDPGAGKTTLLKYITISLIEEKGEEILGISSRLLPFFAPLREMNDPRAEDFCSFMARVCCFDERNITVKDFKELLLNGKAIVLLDGLDEVAASGKRLEVIRWIEKARNAYHKVHFIITSRFAGYTGKYRLDGDLLELAVDDFSPEEIREFLYNWYRTVEGFLHGGDKDAMKKGEAEAEALAGEITGSKRLSRFVKNPLLLQITALVHRDRGHLPERRVELYEECTDILLEKWDMARGLDVRVRAREARKLLQPIALWLHKEDERRSAPLEQITKVLREPLAEIGKTHVDAEALLKNIRDRSGIFTGYSHNEYGFIHLSFQEYLAAEEIRNRGVIDLLVDNYENRWWREVILLTLALDNPSVIGEFIKQIVAHPAFCKEISIVQDALRDSRIKPVCELEQGLSNPAITQTAKFRILTLLSGLAKEGVKNAEDVLLDAVKSKDKQLAGFAERLVKGKEAVHITGEADVAREIRNEKDGSGMILIPAGPFLFGSKEDDKEADQNEKPQRMIELPAFYMDKYPVTNRQYCLFLNETRPGKAKLEKWIELTGKYKKENCRIGLQKRIFTVEKGYEKYPVIYVTWNGAVAYAEWAGKKLPSEQEWEKAARGTEGLKYPWGNEWKEGMCNSWESGIRMTSPVDQFGSGKSIFGCFDMAGNVWEWTASEYEKGKYTVRGGAWDSGHGICRCAIRVWGDPRGRVGGLGFRCARTLTL